jgi:uncharacterized protein (DUF169 family)
MTESSATSISTSTDVDLDVDALCAALQGKIRGSAVAVTMFRDEVHPAYAVSPRVDACGILRIARDEQRAVHMDATRHDCSHGEFLLGFAEGNELMTSGKLLPVFIPAYTLEAGLAVNSGRFKLPVGAVAGIGAAPLEAVPDGAEIEWIVVVAEPVWAGQIAAARSVVDGTPPSSAAGSSFCTDAFVTPWFDDNVIITTGDFGGRMANKLKPSEMFVIVPIRWAPNLISILAAAPDVKGLYEATRTAESDYWDRKQQREDKAAARAAGHADDAAAKAGLATSMEWDAEAVAMVAKAPGFVRKFAVGNVEDYAASEGYDRVTAAVVREQMEAAGVGGMAGATGRATGLLKSLFRRPPKP